MATERPPEAIDPIRHATSHEVPARFAALVPGDPQVWRRLVPFAEQALVLNASAPPPMQERPPKLDTILLFTQEVHPGFAPWLAEIPHRLELRSSLSHSKLINMLAERFAEGGDELHTLVEQGKREWEVSVDTLADVVLLVDDRSRVRRVNRAVERWGIVPRLQEALGKELHELLHGDACHRDGCWLERLWSRAEGIETGNLITENRYDLFLRRHVQVKVHKIVLEQGRFPTFVVLIQDLTPIQRAMSVHQIEQSRLEHLRRLEVLSRFAGGIAHEFNNMLTVIISHAMLLELDLDEEEDADMLQDVLAIRKAAERGADRVRKLLRLTRSARLAREEGLEVEPHVQRFCEYLRTILPPNVTLELELADELPTPVIDAASLEQVLESLTTNAIQAMPDGGTLRITIDHADPPEESQVLAPEWLRLVVADTGVGIPDEDLGRIFDPFFTTRTYEGAMGLGLAICQSIVAQHGGRIRIDSRLGEGTVVEVLLPGLGADFQTLQRMLPEEELEPELMGHGEVILLLEEDAILREFLRRQLFQYRYTPVVAADIREAWVLVEHLGPSISMMVVAGTLRDMLAVDFIEVIHNLLPRLPALVLCNYPDIEQVVEDWRRNRHVAVRTLRRPSSPRELIAGVRELLRQSQPGHFTLDADVGIERTNSNLDEP